MDIRDVIIVGSGPAGLTAAIYTARAKLNPLVIEGNEPGGQLTMATEVENFPGFPEGIQGPDLMEILKKQAARFGTQFVSGAVKSVDFSSRPFAVRSGSVEYCARAVIIATGARARRLGLGAESRLMGHGVSVCATCDGFFFSGKEIVVIGGGDSAVDESLFLTRFASKVTIIHRRNQLRASMILQERAFQNSKIHYLWDTVIIDIFGDEAKGVQKVRLRNVKTNVESDLPCDGVFVAIGYIPNTEPFKGRIEMDGQGFVVTKKGTATSVEGVFAAGDVQDPVYKQAITSAGSGCMAALDVERYLSAQKH